jgi:hypothetical protein
MCEIIFDIIMLTMVATGAYCAHHLSDENPCWVRLVVMAPAIVGMFAPVAVLMGLYEPRVFDVVFAVTVVLLYALVASRFSKKPWLDLRVSK